MAAALDALAEHVDVVTPRQLPPVHAKLVAAGAQLAVSVMGVPIVPVVGPVTEQAGGPEVAPQVNVRVAASQFH